MIIRSFSEDDDLDGLTGLLHRAYAPLAAAGLRYTATYQSAEVTMRRLRTGLPLVAELDGRVIGTVTVYRNNPGSDVPLYREAFYFGQFAVDPDFAGRGVGRALHAAAIRHALDQGARRMGLDTAAPAHDLIATYQRWGYVIVDRIQFSTTNYESVIMCRDLTSTVDTA